MLKELHLAHFKHVFIPVNDHDDDGALGGSHWGLLVYSRHEDTFHLYAAPTVAVALTVISLLVPQF